MRSRLPGSLLALLGAMVLASCTLFNPTGYLGADYVDGGQKEGGARDTGPADRGAGESGQTDDGAVPTSCALTSEVPGVFLCNDFENGLTPAGWSQDIGDGGTVSLDNNIYYQGKHSLHAQIVIGSGGGDQSPLAFLTYSDTLPIHSFARLFVYTTNGAGAETPEAIMNYQLMSGDDGVQFALQSDSDTSTQADLQLNSWTKSGDDFLTKMSSHGFAYGKTWQCVEMEVDEVNGVGNLWLNGNLAVTNKLNDSPYLNLQLGLGIGVNPIPTGTYDVWIDSLMVGTSRFYCPPR
jgi:hypothetical protein